jgi:hypothetical protein
MPGTVVDDLETIQIEKQHCELVIRITMLPANHPGKVVAQIGAVRQAG